MTGTVARLGRILERSDRKRALLLVSLMFIGMMLETLCTGLVLPAIALMMQEDLVNSYPQVQHLINALGKPTQAELITAVMVGLVAIYSVKNVFLGYLAWQQTRFAFHVQVRLSEELFAVYLRQPYTFHLQRNSAQLIRNVAGEVNIVTEAIISGLNVAIELLVFLGISCLLLAVEPVGTLMAVFVLGTSALIFYRVTRVRIARWGATRQQHEVLRYQHLQQGLGGVKDVKLLGRESEFIQQYRFHNVQTAQVGQYLAAVQMLPRLWLELLAVTGLATLVITMLAQGRDISSIFPTLGLFAAAAFRMMPSLNRVLSGAQMLRYAQPVVGTLEKELDLARVQPTDANSRPPSQHSRFEREICLERVSFTYPGAADAAIKDVSIRINRAEAIGFVGPSGSGKSTLIDVILGLLAAETGVVKVDGRSIQVDLRAWQDQIGYVPQSIYLTDDTLRCNVAFGIPHKEIDDVAVERAIKAAQLNDLVASLPDGLDTIVGERGVRLSGGQRQRIGIARALYHDPTVLVLDEATSSLDSATERGVMEAVAALHGTKTILVIAHRLSTVSNCDRLYRLDQGRVVQEIRQSQSAQAQDHGNQGQRRGLG